MAPCCTMTVRAASPVCENGSRRNSSLDEFWPARSSRPKLSVMPAKNCWLRRRLESVSTRSAPACSSRRNCAASSDPSSSTRARPSTMPAAAASTMPSPSPASTIGCSVGAACTIGMAPFTSNSATFGGLAASAGMRSESAVVHRHVGRRDVGGGGAEGDGRPQPRDRLVGELGPDQLRSGGVEALPLEIGAQHDRADAAETREGGERVGLEHALLEPTVEGDEEVHRRRRAGGQRLAARRTGGRRGTA